MKLKHTIIAAMVTFLLGTAFNIVRLDVRCIDTADALAQVSELGLSYGTIAGKVTDSSLRPVANAQVMCWGPKDDGHEYSTVTDSAGNYILVGLNEGTYEVWADAHGYLEGYRTRQEDVFISAQDTMQGIDLTLLKPATLSGTIYASDGRTGIEDVALMLWNYDYITGTGAQTQGEGSFEFTELWPGRSEIYATPSVETGYAAAFHRLFVNEGEVNQDFTLSLEQGALISGQLRSSSEQTYFQCLGVCAQAISAPNRRAEINYLPRIMGQVEAEGTYRLRLTPGQYFLSVDQGMFCSMFIPLSFLPLPCKVVVNNIQQHISCDFDVFFDGASISGNIDDQTAQFDGQILAFTNSSPIIDPLTAWTMRPVGMNQPLSNGDYTIHFLVSPPAYSLYAVTCKSNDPLDLSVISVWDKIENIPAGSSDANFTLQSPGGSIIGTVKGDLSENDIIVLILNQNNEFAGWVKVEYTLGAFDFKMDHLRAGPYTAHALSSAHDEIPQCSFSVIEGETIEIPILTFKQTKTMTRSIANSYRLYTNYPNPFNPTTTIGYDLPHTGHIHLAVYDVLGQRIRILIDKTMERGSYWKTWDGNDDCGRRVASGVYFYRLIVNDGIWTETKKMVLIR
jgi:hypothetical protein